MKINEQNIMGISVGQHQEVYQCVIGVPERERTEKIMDENILCWWKL